MKYLAIAFAIMACNAQTQSNLDQSNTTARAETPVAVSADTLVPPAYENGQLVKSTKKDADWKKILTPQEYDVLRNEGTERAFSGDLVKNHEQGVFICAACGLPLFHSDTKFESGTGWPSFFQPIAADRITEVTDSSHGWSRVEVECARCGGHQGHVFDDGPKPTGLRYCINSVSLDFVKER